MSDRNDLIKVFGSAVLRVAPDTASILIAVSRVEKQPENAFANARNGTQAVTAYLRKTGVKDFGTSRITLTESYQWENGVNRFVGYQAKIAFNVIVRELDKVDVLLSDLISAGANELTSVTFETTRLKAFRADARRRAVVAAREKAALYCDAAGVELGGVISIEDISPDVLNGRNEGHTYREPAAPDDAENPECIDPGAISVGAAVNIYFALTVRQPRTKEE